MMRQFTRSLMVLITLVGILSVQWSPSYGQDEKADKDQGSATDALAIEQGQLADKYQRLEILMLKMAEFDASTNPRRSALLKQALAESKDNHIRAQLENLVALLQQQQLSLAIDEQTQVQQDINSLLQLLLSENRADRNKDEQDRVRQYIKEVDRILRQQRSVQGRTEGGGDPLRLAEQQDKVADRADELNKLIESNERPANADADEDGASKSGEPSEGQPSEGQPSEGQPSEGQPSEGQPSEGQPSQSSENESFPGQKRIAEAERRMREAQQRLEEAKRQEAIAPQEEARRLLEQAKAELEEILRQLREEEIERTLAMLETRFRKMLEMQLKVYEETLQLSEIPFADRGSQVDIEAGKLSVQERRIAAEADRALLLLREEGSSVAFPEAVEQMRADMQQVAQRLSRTKLDRITMGLEEDIIAALEEMIEALQRAQQEAEERRNQPPGQQPQGQPQDQPLVDAIAELKMIRTLQLRVNKRTQRYARLLDEPDSEEGQATDEDLIESLGRLSQREERIRSITRDIVLGKNR